jgi:hypothetical protein
MPERDWQADWEWCRKPIWEIVYWNDASLAKARNVLVYWLQRVRKLEAENARLKAVAEAVQELREKQDVLLERLAELEHEQWVAWARTLMETEQLSKQRKQRWQQYMVPYAELSEDVKEHDRVWARKAVAIVNEWLRGVIKDAGQDGES